LCPPKDDVDLALGRRPARQIRMRIQLSRTSTSTARQRVSFVDWGFGLQVMGPRRISTGYEYLNYSHKTCRKMQRIDSLRGSDKWEETRGEGGQIRPVFLRSIAFPHPFSILIWSLLGSCSLAFSFLHIIKAVVSETTKPVLSLMSTTCKREARFQVHIQKKGERNVRQM